ncbi:hypothetical protein B5C34_08555 [Pacificimonas flava]|uniref:Transglutaminase-like domain-containing protein n=2 Tax=Pacificimonas TaxID=1960290 RepID=A0A219B5P8_9SPHN|nr:MULTISPECIES: hypothetical protein [Pacificimonas]MBZ6379286.1 hypothetical protein [Pacificimonas aurantium]OWV33504.1 hypothetical protein B5C34_08555 [Pacificimonas flava]
MMPALRALLLFLIAAGVAGAAFFGLSRWNDQQAFRSVIRTEMTEPVGTGAFVEDLNHWVYNKEGFAQCQDRYVWDPLGATPMQIFEAGGDCADKSRLLSAMLASVGMDSTLVMLQPCRSCAPTHTIVNAELSGGDLMAADPVYDLVFPDPAGGYFGVAEVRDRPAILAARLEQLKRQRGPEDKINFHSEDEMKYGFPKTINWDRDPAFRTAGGLVGAVTDEPFLVQRPHFFEDPKLFLTLFFLGIAAASSVLLLLIDWRRR